MRCRANSRPAAGAALGRGAAPARPRVSSINATTTVTKDLLIMDVRSRLAIAALLVAASSLPAAAQHETAADIQEGGRVFAQACANCHGPDGDLIAGIDLGRNVFKTAKTDEDLVRIIRTGVPNAGMPPNNMSVEQAQRVVSFLRSSAAAKRSNTSVGDAARGKSIYETKGNCASCHRVGQNGARIGPDLTTIGRIRRSAELELAIVDPAAAVQPQHRFYRVVVKDGTSVTGRLMNLDTFSVQMMDTKEQLRSFLKANLKEHGWAPTPMPSYKATLTAQELADVVSYLASLKG
jgi:putative heme-binding domain-containing protein